jgi:hypothetical protein
MYLPAAGPRVFLRKTGAGAENADGERFGGEIGL